MSLKTELMEIRGVGEATAESILEVLEESDEYGTDVEQAIDYIETGHPNYALKFLKQ